MYTPTPQNTPDVDVQAWAGVVERALPSSSCRPVVSLHFNLDRSGGITPGIQPGDMFQFSSFFLCFLCISNHYEYAATWYS